MDINFNKIFEDRSNCDYRISKELEKVSRIAALVRDKGLKIVLTSGSYDMLHEGHVMYLEAARGCGDFLFVGLDSDKKIKHRKGENRPIIPEDERAKIICHQRGVGAVYIKQLEDPKWEFIKTVKPDVLVVTEETYDKETLEIIEKKFKLEIVCLPRTSQTSTSSIIREMNIKND